MYLHMASLLRISFPCLRHGHSFTQSVVVLITEDHCGEVQVPWCRGELGRVVHSKRIRRIGHQLCIVLFI